MCFNSHQLQMSFLSLCLIFVTSLVLQILPCVPQCFHLLHDGTTNFSSGIDTATQTSFFLNWSFLFSWLLLGRFCINDVAAFVILFLILNCRCLLFGTCLILLCLQAIMYAIFPTSQMHLYGQKHFTRNVHTGKFLCINI